MAIDLDDSEAAAITWQIAANAKEQFWDNMGADIRKGFYLFGIVLTVTGISIGSIIPGWLDKKASEAINESIVAKEDVFNKVIDRFQNQTLEAYTDLTKKPCKFSSRQMEQSPTLKQRWRRLRKPKIG